MQKENGTAADRLRRQQKALADFGLLAFRSRDLDEILHRASELVSEGLDVRRAKILELLPGGTELLVRAGVNWNPGIVGRARLGAESDSPAGYALRTDEPVVSPDLDAETRFEIPQVLIDHGIRSMINVIIAGDQGPFGVLEVDAARPRDFDEDDIAFLRTYANLLAAAIDRHRSHLALEQAASEQSILVQELSHRVRNILGLVQSLAGQMSSEKPGAREFKEAFVGRLHALATAENLITDYQTPEVDLERLVRTATEPFEAQDGRGGILIEGERVNLPTRNGRFMALVLHELGTNSAKYGALSSPDGKVHISWELETTGDGRFMRLYWKETGGPAVEKPVRQGFGTRLLEELAAYELDGEAELNYEQSGLEYRISFPIRNQ